MNRISILIDAVLSIRHTAAVEPYCVIAFADSNNRFRSSVCLLDIDFAQ